MYKILSKKLNTEKNNAGFTLIEVLVAVSIFAVSLTALMSMLGKGISDITVARNKLVANYLAQEGIEIVRYSRDFATQYPGAGGWAAFKSGVDSCIISAPCGVTELHPTDPPTPCTLGGDSDRCRIVTDSIPPNTSSGAYSIKSDQSAWEPTVFTRKIYIDNPGIAQESRVIHSVVTWTQGFGNHTVGMSETLYNW